MPLSPESQEQVRIGQMIRAAEQTTPKQIAFAEKFAAEFLAHIPLLRAEGDHAQADRIVRAAKALMSPEQYEDQAAEQADMAAKAARLRQLMGDDEGDEECLFPNA